MIFKSTSPTFTKKIAAQLARELTAKKSKNALIIGLTGDLGSGKTTFIQGFAHGLGIKQKLPSPTFVIMRNYKLATTHYSLLCHIDSYRLKNTGETKILNLKEIIKNSENILLIEWAEKIKKILPKKMIRLKFRHGEKENERIIGISKQS